MRDTLNDAEAYLVEAGFAVPSMLPETGIDRDLTKYNWFDIGSGIILAGGAYPFVVAVIGIVIGTIVTIWTVITGGEFPSPTGELIGGIVMAMTFAFMGGIGGIIWAAIVTMVTGPVVYLFVRSLRIRGNVVWLGAVWGGLVGFLAMMPATLPLLGSFREFGSATGFIIILAAGPGLTTIVGQVGGTAGGRNALRNWQRLSNCDAALAAMKANSGVAERESEIDKTAAPLRFGIRHLLWITFWMSLLLSVIRLSGIPFEYVLPLLAGWLAFQTATLYLGNWLGPWWARRRAARAGRNRRRRSGLT
jgi:hypothetical protein